MAEQGEARESFRASGQVTGWVCVVLAAAVVVLAVVEHRRGMPWWVLAAGVTFGVLSWAVLLRPRVALVDGALELRGSFDTVTLPLVDVEMLAVGRVLSASTEERRWTSAALGRSARQTRRDDEAAAASRSGGAGQTTQSYAAVVERRLQDALAQAHLRPPARAAAPGVVRRLAWPEITAVAVTALATVVLLAL